MYHLIVIKVIVSLQLLFGGGSIMKYESCLICCGRGGLGSSHAGVTLSYRVCNHCQGEGVISIPENETEAKQLEEDYQNKQWLMLRYS